MRQPVGDGGGGWKRFAGVLIVLCALTGCPAKTDSSERGPERPRARSEPKESPEQVAVRYLKALSAMDSRTVHGLVSAEDRSFWEDLLDVDPAREVTELELLMATAEYSAELVEDTGDRARVDVTVSIPGFPSSVNPVELVLEDDTWKVFDNRKQEAAEFEARAAEFGAARDAALAAAIGVPEVVDQFIELTSLQREAWNAELSSSERFVGVEGSGVVEEVRTRDSGGLDSWEIVVVDLRVTDPANSQRRISVSLEQVGRDQAMALNRGQVVSFRGTVHMLGLPEFGGGESVWMKVYVHELTSAPEASQPEAAD
jgi:hypothetical protein